MDFDSSVLNKVNRHDAAIWRGHIPMKEIRDLGFQPTFPKNSMGFILWNERNLKRFKIRNLFTF